MTHEVSINFTGEYNNIPNCNNITYKNNFYGIRWFYLRC